MESIKVILLLPTFIGQLFCQTDSCILERSYFSTKKIESEGCIVHGKREGKWTEFIEYNDKYYMRFSWTYKNGLKDGPYEAFFENGNTEVIGQWREGRLVDTVKIFNIDGELSEINVWVPDTEPGSSHTIFHKKVYKNPKPDNTIEKIDGIDYIWVNGQPTRYFHKRKTKKKK